MSPIDKAIPVKGWFLTHGKRSNVPYWYMNVVENKVGVALIRSVGRNIEEDVEWFFSFVERLPREEFETDLYIFAVIFGIFCGFGYGHDSLGVMAKNLSPRCIYIDIVIGQISILWLCSLSLVVGVRLITGIIAEEVYCGVKAGRYSEFPFSIVTTKLH